jgi:hypothetical protein
MSALATWQQLTHAYRNDNPQTPERLCLHGEQSAASEDKVHARIILV